MCKNSTHWGFLSPPSDKVRVQLRSWTSKLVLVDSLALTLGRAFRLGTPSERRQTCCLVTCQNEWAVGFHFAPFCCHLTTGSPNVYIGLMCPLLLYDGFPSLFYRVLLRLKRLIQGKERTSIHFGTAKPVLSLPLNDKLQEKKMQLRCDCTKLPKRTPYKLSMLSRPVVLLTCWWCISEIICAPLRP